MKEKQMPLLARSAELAHAKVEREKACPKCRREQDQCLCGKVTSFSNKIRVVILQHPQEQYKLANSAALSHLILRNSTLLTGLSWKSFKSITGEDEKPSQWAILYLKGSMKLESDTARPMYCYDKNDSLIDSIPSLRGIIAIDGTWKQAKALWWRNSWFLKLNRISLNPQLQSLRNQSKEEGLSTIEAIAFTLRYLGEKSIISDSLIFQYKKKILGTEFAV
jgi:DTW domain-containing protein YfiP